MENLNSKTPSFFTTELIDHSWLLTQSFYRVTGRYLCEPLLSAKEAARFLFEADFGLVSHGTEADPVFNYANQTALGLFERTFEEWTKLPSRLSAEPEEEVKREALLKQVHALGFVDRYRGVRISKSGRKFLIEDTTIWNVVDEKGFFRGQAALIPRWAWVE